MGTVAPAAGQTSDGPPDPGPAIHNLSMTATPGTGLPGVSALDTTTVDVGSLPLFPETSTDDAVSAPLRSSPLRSSPLRSSPLRSSPLRSSPLRSSPLRSSPLRSSPLRSSFLPPMPLSSVPLLVEGGWATVLVGTEYEGITLGAVTLQQVFDLTPTPDALTGLTLFDVDLAATPLGKSSIQAFLLSGATLATLSPYGSVCGAFTSFDCAAHGMTDDTATLLDLEWAGAPMSEISFLQYNWIGTTDLTPALITGYDLLAVDLDATSLGTIPAQSLPEVVTCGATGFTCDETTNLATAVQAHLAGTPAITADATLGQVLARTDLFTVANLSYGDLVRSVVDAIKLDYAGVALGPVLFGTPVDATSSRLVRYTAEATVDCRDSEDIFFGFYLPTGFRYVDGSAEKSVNGGEPVAAEPWTPPVVEVEFLATTEAYAVAPSRQPDVRFLLGEGFTCSENPDEGGIESEHITLSFSALPGVTLGSHTAGVEVTTFTSGDPGRSTAELVPHTAPFSVGDDFEPNDTPGDATPVTPGTLYLSHISDGDDVDYYTLPTGLVEGTRISAVLSHLPNDFDLFLDGPSATPVNSSPLRSSPLRSSPLNQTPLEDTGTGDLNGDTLSPEALQDVPLTDVLSVSDKRGTETEVASVIVRESDAATPYVLAVTHHLGTTSREPYMLQVFVDPPPELTCAENFSLANGTRGTLPGLTGLDPETKTLFVVNQQRMEAAFGAADTATALTALTGLAARPEVKGLVVPVDGDATVVQRYATWDANRCSPEAANDVSTAITTVLRQYATALPNLQYVVMVGDDDVVPFTRLFDGATLSNQRDYYENVVFDGVDNPISAAAAYSMILSDNGYTDADTTPFLDRQLLTPDFVGARLVETPAEITGVIDTYTKTPYVDLADTLTTGYDFIVDGATAVDQKLATGGGATATLINETWTATELATALTGKTVASVNAHFDHSNLLPALGNSSQATDPTLFSSSTLLTAGLPAGALLFTIGCQAGLNVPGRAWATATGDQTERLRDWAQTLSQLKAMGFLGNTGHGYGDDAVVAYSERFIDLFSERLDGSMTIGQAVMAARDAYTREVSLDVYHEKVLHETTFYGLPFARVGATGSEAPITGDAATGAPLPVDPTYGVQAATFSITPTLAEKTTSAGTYYTVPGQQPATALYRPVMPATGITLPPTPAGTIQGDVLITGLTSGAATTINTPAFVTPTPDRTAFNTPATPTDVAYPVSLWSNAAEGGITLYPAQLRSTDDDGATLFTQETLTSITGKVLYPTADTITLVRPTIARATAVDLTGTTTFQVDVTGSEQVLVLYRPVTGATWQATPLADVATGSDFTPTSEPTILSLSATSAEATPTRTFVATVAGATAEYFVQAVHDGLVGSARGKGLNLQPVEAAESGLDITVSGVQANGWYQATPTLTVTGGDGVVFEASVNGSSFQTVPAGGLALETSGLNAVEVRGSDGSTGTAYALVDADKPTVDITTPTEGEYVSRPAEASFTCSDVGSGIDVCEAIDSTTLNTTAGEYQFRVRAVDFAGNETIATVNYTGGYMFEGFFSPVENPDVLNIVQAGSTVPMKFRVKHGDGELISDTAVVQSTTSRQIDCPNAETSVVTTELLEATTTSGLRYSSTDEQFVFTWKLNKLWAGQCREFTLTLDDGSTHLALFQMK